MAAKPKLAASMVTSGRKRMDRAFLLDVAVRAQVEQAMSSPNPGHDALNMGHPRQDGLTTMPGVTEMTGVRIVSDASGKKVLTITVRDGKGRLLPPNVMDWCRFGDIGTAFAEALYAETLKPATLAHKIRTTSLFLSWLGSQSEGSKTPSALSDLTSGVFARFLSHVQAGVGEDGTPHATGTKRTRIGVVRTIVANLKRSAAWKSRFASKSQVPPNPWRATHKRSKPRPLLSEDELRAIIMACTREIQATHDRHEEGRALIIKGRPKLRAGMDRRTDFASMDVMLAAIEDWMSGYARDIDHVIATNWPLGQALILHRARLVFSYLYPDARTLVPFIVLLAIHTAYNPTQLLGMELKQIALHDVFDDQFRMDRPERHNSRGIAAGGTGDSPRLMTAAKKDRAGRRIQNRSFRIDPEDLFGPYMLVEGIKMLTERIRPHIAMEDRDRLIIYHQLSGKPGVQCFGTAKGGVGGDALWHHHFKKFIADNKLPNFGLSSVRSSMADVAEQLTGDIRAVQLLLGHAGTNSAFQHYFSAGARRRATESVALAQGFMQRWAETGGKRDVRDRGPGDNLMAATPGFGCLDPWDSPMPGQVKGKLCSAYLGCFDCPLRTVDQNEAYSFARLVQIERHIMDGRSTVPAARYKAVYIPLLPKIAELLTSFTPGARTGALKVTYLRPLPELE